MVREEKRGEKRRGSVMERDTEMERLTEIMRKISRGREREREDGVEERLRGCQEVGLDRQVPSLLRNYGRVRFLSYATPEGQSCREGNNRRLLR